MFFDDFVYMHDSVLCCCIEVNNTRPTEETLSEITKRLPSEIRELASDLGWFNSEVEEKICKWIRENYCLIK